MASFFKLTIGQIRELERILAGVFTAADVERIIRDPSLAKKMADAIASGTTTGSSSSSSCVMQVERQLARWNDVGVAIDRSTRKRILLQAAKFTPFTNSDEPLVTGGFGYNLRSVVDRLWESITPPTGYHKAPQLLTRSSLHHAYGMMPRTGSGFGIRLVHYDPIIYHGLNPQVARVQARSGGFRVAGVEVLEKILVDPESCTKWNGKDRPFPDLSGIKVQYGSSWSRVPSLHRLDVYHQLRLGHNDSNFDYFDSRWSSVLIREC